jgi:biopolymer transport protein ExbD
MHLKPVVVLVALCGCFVSPVMHFGGGKTASEAQHDEAKQLTPPALTVDNEWTGPIATAKVRVYADDDYRAQNVHWEQSFADELAYTNEVLGAAFGVKLVAEYREWSHHAPGETLQDALAELQQLDRGDGVLTVIGLTSSLSLVSATFENIGMGALPGRHVVVRGYADVFERQAFDRAFGKLEPEEREAMYVARRRHKKAALLLHELGHNFGAAHVEDADTIMNAMYSDHSAAFDAHSREVIRATLDERLHRRSAQATTASATREPAPAHATLVIALDAQGVPHVGGQPVDDASLGELLKLTFDDDHDTEVVVKAPRKAPHEAVIKVLEAAKAAGLTRLALAGE